MIQGHRIRLRAVEREDLPTIWRWENDPDVMEFASSAPDRCISRHVLEQSLFNGNPNEGMRRYMILDEKGDSIGLISWWQPNPRFHGSIEVGLYIGNKELWRRGYGTDALLTLSRALFLQIGAHRVSLATGAHNVGMRNLMEKLGIPLEGIIRQERFIHGQYYDTLRLGFLREEFEEIERRWRASVDEREGARRQAALGPA